LSRALEGVAGWGLGHAAGSAHAFDAEEHFQQIFLSRAQVCAELFGAGIGVDPSLSILALGNALYGYGLLSDVPLEGLPALFELRQRFSGVHLTSFRCRSRRRGLRLCQGYAEAE
jgi:hypothetical protein